MCTEVHISSTRVKGSWDAAGLQKHQGRQEREMHFGVSSVKLVQLPREKEEEPLWQLVYMIISQTESDLIYTG